jgi:hypothetical protein
MQAIIRFLRANIFLAIGGILLSCRDNGASLDIKDFSISTEAHVPKTILIDRMSNFHALDVEIIHGSKKNSFYINYDNTVNIFFYIHNNLNIDTYINDWNTSFKHAKNNIKYLAPAVFHDDDDYFIKYVDHSIIIYYLSDNTYENLRGIVFSSGNQSQFCTFSMKISDKSYVMQNQKIIELIKSVIENNDVQ